MRFSLQGELTSQLGTMAQNQFLAQGEFGNGAYFVRDRLAWRVFGHYTFGPEAIAKGSRVYQAPGSRPLCFPGDCAHLAREPRWCRRCGPAESADRRRLQCRDVGELLTEEIA